MTIANPFPFYLFRDNSSFNPQFTWAASILARSPMIEWECPECGRVRSYPSGSFDVVVEGGNTYPDVLGCGAYPFLIVSESVIRAWDLERATSFHTYAVSVADVQSESLKDLPPPKYFRVEIDGRCRVDLEATGIKVEQVCSMCKAMKRPLNYIRKFHLLSGSWDGSSLFRDADFFPRVNFCTEQIRKLTAKYELTNFRFDLQT